jgi:hypothetical protein
MFVHTTCTELNQLKVLASGEKKIQMEQKALADAEIKELNARSPLALACFSKNPAMLQLLLEQKPEIWNGLPWTNIQDHGGGVEKPALKLHEWCFSHFELGGEMLRCAQEFNTEGETPQIAGFQAESLKSYIEEPLFGVFLQWRIPKRNARHEMTISELIEGFRQFTWPSENSLKKLAVLGMCGVEAEPIAESVLPMIFLSSLKKAVNTKEGAIDDIDDIDDIPSTWDSYSKAFTRKLEKLFFAALKLDEGTKVAYHSRNFGKIQGLVKEGEKEYRKTKAVLQIYKAGRQVSCSDIYRSIRSENQKLGLKSLKLGETLRRELKADLEELGQRRQQGIRLADPKALQETKRIHGSQSCISSKEFSSEKWFYCTIPKTDAAPVQEPVIDYPQFRWVLGVICEEHLGGMSVGEFARLFFLEKVVNLTNEPEGFYNLQDVRLSDHHMNCARVYNTVLRGALWNEVTGTSDRNSGVRSKYSVSSKSSNTSKDSSNSKQTTRTKMEKKPTQLYKLQSAQDDGDGKSWNRNRLKDEWLSTSIFENQKRQIKSLVDNTNLIQIRLGKLSMSAALVGEDFLEPSTALAWQEYKEKTVIVPTSLSLSLARSLCLCLWLFFSPLVVSCRRRARQRQETTTRHTLSLDVYLFLIMNMYASQKYSLAKGESFFKSFQKRRPCIRLRRSSRRSRME